VGPRAGLDAEVRGKILCLCRGSNPGRPVRSQTLYRLSYYQKKYISLYQYLVLLICIYLKDSSVKLSFHHATSCSNFYTFSPDMGVIYKCGLQGMRPLQIKHYR
jgi:hypothetical protein